MIFAESNYKCKFSIAESSKDLKSSDNCCWCVIFFAITERLYDVELKNFNQQGNKMYEPFFRQTLF